MPTAYFARPIDFFSLTSSQTARAQQYRDLLVAEGWVVYDPSSAFRMGPGLTPNPTVQQINRAALCKADALVACYPEAQTIGVPMELELASSRGIPTICLSDAGPKSWALAALRNTAITADFDEYLVKSLAQRVQQYRDEHDGTTRRPLRVKVHELGQLPTRAHNNDAGFDMYVAEDTIIPPDAFVDVPCGISVELPEHSWAMITGRSSTLRKSKLLVTTGIIDTGYRGPLFAGVQNLDFENEFHAKAGTRLAQLIVLPNMAMNLVPVPVADLSRSDRGESGFGSSGV
jgi:dUTP pyrophosphatase